ncbi:hypothetical protein NDU88_006676 [Pleurodeles waltl]|uniref:Uncharacterized protein n=1 Tax=Pleurodeles waltl TaxID=8319 RepID=A0AAV7QKP0_PLEWA|nr:hypothetical protein NDU88_006676 [Pleurodeles waltl]
MAERPWGGGVAYTRQVRRKVQHQRRSFDEVKKMLCSKEIKYMMLFPARIWVLVEDKSWYFNTTVEAWDWDKGRPAAAKCAYKDTKSNRTTDRQARAPAAQPAASALDPGATED